MNKSMSKNNREAGFAAMAKGQKKGNEQAAHTLGGKVNTSVKNQNAATRRQGQRGQ